LKLRFVRVAKTQNLETNFRVEVVERSFAEGNFAIFAGAPVVGNIGKDTTRRGMPKDASVGKMMPNTGKETKKRRPNIGRRIGKKQSSRVV
jgi:hypothetical protein